MTSDEQLQLWVHGDPRHNHAEGECCPDFSCCEPALLQPYEVRLAFLHGTEQRRHELLMTFLAAAMSRAGDKRAHIAGRGESS